MERLRKDFFLNSSKANSIRWQKISVEIISNGPADNCDNIANALRGAK
jgi:hypothetical protein